MFNNNKWDEIVCPAMDSFIFVEYKMRLGQIQASWICFSAFHIFVKGNQSLTIVATLWD